MPAKPKISAEMQRILDLLAANPKLRLVYRRGVLSSSATIEPESISSRSRRVSTRVGNRSANAVIRRKLVEPVTVRNRSGVASYDWYSVEVYRHKTPKENK
jgi:hypothetical protein